MATVLGVTVNFLRGGTAPLRQRLDIWSIAGRAGTGAQLMGVNQSSFSYEAILYGDDADVNARAAALHLAQGTIGAIVDDFGDTNGNCLLVTVGEPQRKRVILNGVPGMRLSIGLAGVRT